MTIFRIHSRPLIHIMLALTITATPVMADKAGRGEYKQKSHQQKQYKSHDDFGRNRESYRSHQQNQQYPGFFKEHQRVLIRDFYVNKYRTGRCPPGLAKKHNGCFPPGQAKRWAIGRPLPRDLIFYDLPDTIIRQIGYPPIGYRYVRVASDILMITLGAGLVVDAIADLNEMP